jgi:hypothetical protein
MPRGADQAGRQLARAPTAAPHAAPPALSAPPRRPRPPPLPTLRVHPLPAAAPPREAVLSVDLGVLQPVAGAVVGVLLAGGGEAGARRVKGRAAGRLARAPAGRQCAHRGGAGQSGGSRSGRPARLRTPKPSPRAHRVAQRLELEAGRAGHGARARACRGRAAARRPARAAAAPHAAAAAAAAAAPGLPRRAGHARAAAQREGLPCRRGRRGRLGAARRAGCARSTPRRGPHPAAPQRRPGECGGFFQPLAGRAGRSGAAGEEGEAVWGRGGGRGACFEEGP